jgi:predicted AAA+ superfamily ATPase
LRVNLLEKGECDFVVKEKNKVTYAIQVCTELSQETLPREVNGLVEALTFFYLEEGIIITMNQEDEIIQAEKKIHVIPAWKWFMY